MNFGAVCPQTPLTHPTTHSENSSHKYNITHPRLSLSPASSMQLIGSASDYTSFLQVMRIPSLEPRYAWDRVDNFLIIYILKYI